MKNVMIMKDCRNGIYPVVVFIPDNPTEDGYVDCIYPYGCEEYTGQAKFGRFMPIDEDISEVLLHEIFRLRYVVQKVTGSNDHNMSDICDFNYEDVIGEIPDYKFKIHHGDKNE